MTAARRRDLHVSVNPGRRADNSLRSGEFVAKWCRTATAHRWRLALDIGRACSPFLGRRISGRLRQRHICRCDTDERCKDAAAILMNAARIKMVGRKGNSSRTCRAYYSTRGRVKCSRDVAARGRARVSGDFGVKNIVAVFGTWRDRQAHRSRPRATRPDVRLAEARLRMTWSWLSVGQRYVKPVIE
jgi:hypothetical protein